MHRFEVPRSGTQFHDRVIRLGISIVAATNPKLGIFAGHPFFQVLEHQERSLERENVTKNNLGGDLSCLRTLELDLSPSECRFLAW
ncbi:unnamed protein product [Linum trigynum]|uniref:Uncharacterized protein n=1 Tax=Linum trigynum TaxID=586398 RepID=A0AAV2FMR1_9ROSI